MAKPKDKPKAPESHSATFNKLRKKLGYDVGSTRLPEPSEPIPTSGFRIRVVQGGAPELGKRGSR